MKREVMQRTLCGTVGDIAFTGIFDNDTRRSKDNECNPKMHNWYEINIIYEGEYSFEGLKNNVAGPFHKGDAVLITPGYYHEAVRLDEKLSAKYRIRFEIEKAKNPDNDEKLYDLLLKELQLLGHGIFLFQLQNGIKYFDEISERLACGEKGSVAVAEATFKMFMTEFFMEILHLCTGRKRQTVLIGVDDNEISRKDIIEAFLDKNHSNSKLAAEMLAKQLHVSVRQMNRIVSNLYKMTFYQLLTSVRLEHAKELLLSSGLTIKEVAFKVGYDSSTGFFVAFRKKYGVTPGEFCEIEKRQQ